MRWIPKVAWTSGVVLVAAGLTGCSPTWRADLAVEDASEPASSPDGTKIAFASRAPHVPFDTNGLADVYLRDLATGETTLLSVNAAGTNGGDADSWDPVFSPDGTRVAFNSSAGDLGPRDTNGLYDVYVRSLTGAGHRRTRLVSANAAGTDSGDGTSFDPVFSPDGTRLAFTSAAGNLGPADTNGENDIYLRSLRSRRTVLLSVDGTGTNGGDGESWAPEFSGDGRQVVFVSMASDLGANDTNGVEDVYLRDLRSRATTLVSVNAAGTDSGNGRSNRPTISRDGTRVAFTSYASDLGPTDSDGDDVYVRDLTTGASTLVSVNAAGTNGGNGESFEPVFSPDGTKVAFSSNASDLSPLDTGTDYFDWDVYLRDLTTATTTLVSVDATGTRAGNGYSLNPVFSPDGRTIAFESEANDLGPTDTNTCPVRPTDPARPCVDVYVRDLVGATTSLASAAGGDSLLRALSDSPVFAPRDSTRLAFTSTSVGTFTDSIYVAAALTKPPG